MNKQKKFLLLLPVIALPFLTLGFWAMGGGRSASGLKKEAGGLQLELPASNVKEEKDFDKLSFYERAEKDSQEYEEWMKNDPYFKKDTAALEAITDMTSEKYGQRLNSSLDTRGNKPEEEILKKLQQLQEEIDKPAKAKESVTESNMQFDETLTQAESSDDGEIDQLSGTLDKILDIQHPERVKERSMKNKGAVYAVRRETGIDTMTAGFFSYSDEKETEDPNSIEAVIATDQVIVNGAVIRFRLIHDVFVAGKLVRANTVVAGVAQLEGERLYAEIGSVRSGGSLYNVRLDVYDMDGLPGIYIPGTINREVAKESLNNSLALADVSGYDPSLKSRAATTGINTLKTLVGKKAKLVRVQVKAGYKVLFKNKNQDQ